MDYMTRMEDAFADREAKRQVREDAAKEGLAAEFMTAFYGNPLEVIRTPAYGDSVGGRPSMPLLVYLEEDMNPARMLGLVQIVKAAAMGGDVAAQKFIEDWADSYAEFNCQDAAEE